MCADEASDGMHWLDAVDVVFLLVRVRMKGKQQVTWFMLSVGAWLNQELIADWPIRMRLCKQTPHGPHDIIWLEEILGDTPFEYINRADGLN